jgi:hypothetical protein
MAGIKLQLLLKFDPLHNYCNAIKPANKFKGSASKNTASYMPAIWLKVLRQCLK